MTPANWKLLADLVDLLHVLVVIVLLGGVLLRITTKFFNKHPRLYQIHLMVVVTTMISQITFLCCPLTILSQALRRQYNPDIDYYGSFIVYLILQNTGVQIPTIIMTVGTFGLVTFTIAAYMIWKANPKHKEKKED